MTLTTNYYHTNTVKTNTNNSLKDRNSSDETVEEPEDPSKFTCYKVKKRNISKLSPEIKAEMEPPNFDSENR